MLLIRGQFGLVTGVGQRLFDAPDLLPFFFLEDSPDATPNPIEDINPANDERAIDVGESGQFAPGGRYNELGATRPRRLDLDEQVDSALKESE